MKKWIKRYVCWVAFLAALSSVYVAVTGGARAQDDPPPTTTAAADAPPADAPAVTETKAADAPPPTAGAAAPVPPALPPYFTGTDPPGTADKDKKWPDATGVNAGYWATPSAGPIGDDDPAKQTIPGLYDRIVHNLFSINMVWTLITGFLVMFMQAGFMFVETGLCRAKNSSHTAAMNLMIYPLGCLAFWVYGFALGWGNWYNAPVPGGWYSSLGPGTSQLTSGVGIGENLGDDGKPNGTYKYGLLGTKGFFLSSVDDVSILALFFFMMVFMDTTATIPTGAMAERWAWKNFCLFGLWIALPYCVYANWVWGGGWLAQCGMNWGLGHGAVDFAGSGVVHAMGGFIGLAGAMVLGPRIGKYVGGKVHAIPGHNIPMVVLGTFILAFGWFGFNPGSTLSGTDLRTSAIVVNTMLAGVTGALATMCYLMVRGMKPDPSMMCNGTLAGLVAITAPSAFVDSMGAAIIGAVAGVLVVEAVFFFDRVGVDDPVGAISVHGINGLWGLISVGLFANGKYGAGSALPTGGFGAGWNGVLARKDMVAKYGSDGVRGLFYGDASQLWAQLLDAAVVAAFGFVMAYVWFKVSNLITPIRVSRQTEIEGLDGPEMGALGYPDFALKGGALDA